MLKLHNITFLPDRATILVEEKRGLSSFERNLLVAKLLERHNNLSNHDCVNSHGPKFGDCIRTTSLAHIFEHLIIEAAIESWPNFKMIGNTKKKTGHFFEINVTYKDDIVLLKIINDSVVELNSQISEVSN